MYSRDLRSSGLSFPHHTSLARRHCYAVCGATPRSPSRAEQAQLRTTVPLFVTEPSALRRFSPNLVEPERASFGSSGSPKSQLRCLGIALRANVGPSGYYEGVLLFCSSSPFGRSNPATQGCSLSTDLSRSSRGLCFAHCSGGFALSPHSHSSRPLLPYSYPSSLRSSGYS